MTQVGRAIGRLHTRLMLHASGIEKGDSALHVHKYRTRLAPARLAA